MKTANLTGKFHPYGKDRSGTDREQNVENAICPALTAGSGKSLGPVGAGYFLHGECRRNPVDISTGNMRRHHYNVGVRTRTIAKELRLLPGRKPAAAGPFGTGPVHRKNRRFIA
jgi:hypothetical protein